MDMISMDEAIRIVLQHTSPIDVANVGLMDALGCTLAQDVRSDIDMPPFDKATMDGYAVVGNDVAVACSEDPAILDVIEEIPAGSVPQETVSPGHAARIMTGAPVPDGADTVVMVEDTVSERDGEGVRVLAPTEPGRNVAPLGEDVRRGQVVLEAGTWIRPPEIGILAAVGVVGVPVYRRPVVGVVATGSEIVEPGNSPAAGQIRNSNGYSMMAQALRSGAQTRYLGIVEDDEVALKNVISRGLDDCDVVLLSGGVSAGIYDLVQGAMRDCGVEIYFDRIRMKPGKPLTFGARGSKLVFGLPGNPVSAVVGLELLGRPFERCSGCPGVTGRWYGAGWRRRSGNRLGASSSYPPDPSRSTAVGKVTGWATTGRRTSFPFRGRTACSWSRPRWRRSTPARKLTSCCWRSGSAIRPLCHPQLF